MSELTVIRGGRVLSRDPAKTEFADIFIEQGRIAAVERAGTAAPEGAGIINADDRLLIPGLVNAHAHSHLYLAKSMAEQWTLELHLNAGPYTSGNQVVEDKRLAAKLSAAELIRKGCTATYDMYADPPAPSHDSLMAVAEGYQSVGMRAVVAPLVADRLFWDAVPGLSEKIPPDLRQEVDALKPESAEVIIAAYKQLFRSWSFDKDALRLAVAPIIPHHCGKELLINLADLAADNGTSIHFHLAESKVQAISGISHYGKTLTAFLDEIGVLNSRFIAGHAIWVDDDDIRLLSERGALVAHNPTSNLRLGSGLAPIRKMLDRGITVGIGTDTPSCSDDMNMFIAMRCAAYIARAQGPSTEKWIDAETIFDMATVGGAKVLGFPDIGRLLPGYQADIVFLDLGSPNWVPFNNAVNQLVYSEDGSAVDSVMIGGRLVLDHGRFTTIDYAMLRGAAEDAVGRLREVNNNRQEIAQRLESVVGPHCRSLAEQPYHINRYAGDIAG